MVYIKKVETRIAPKTHPEVPRRHAAHPRRSSEKRMVGKPHQEKYPHTNPHFTNHIFRKTNFN